MRTLRLTGGVLRVCTCSALLGVCSPALAQTMVPATVSSPIPAAAPLFDQTVATPQSENVSRPSFGLGSVVHGTLDGFSNLRSLDTLKWLGIGAGIAAAAASVDGTTSGAMSGTRALDRPFDPGQTIGGARFQLVGALGTYGVGLATKSPRVSSFGSDLLQAQIVSQTITAGIKMAARRTRPDGTMYSFPSGHSSVSFASATVVQRHFGWKAGLAAYGVASYVAASRIQEKRHFLSDVAFGATIGILAGRAVTIGAGEHRFAVSPMAAPGGGGVSFTWLGNR